MPKVWKFDNNVNTDQVIPGRYYPREKVEELGDYCLCELHPNFSKEKKEGDVIVAGNNFGCGSSREYAALALRYSGVKCVIARSFARIFYRNCINVGFPILICDELFDNVQEGDEIEVELETGIIRTNGKEYRATPLPEFVMKIKEAGGIVNFLKTHDIEELK
ncbi:3-isopropylmalate dehydratase small subunit [Candidatus Woesearchaeota archaeon]|nr:3-isopropylmalate dehydratase small subunit [Candidatus Woesearchaeota archaeon]